MSNSLRPDMRGNSSGPLSFNHSVFPFDAFEFDDPNRKSKPNLTMKNPWQFKIGDSNLPWAEEKHGIIPANGWFAQFTALNEVDLSSELSLSVVSPSFNNLKVSSYGVNGKVQFDFTDFPVDFTNYTIIFRHQSNWQYLTSGGVTNASYIDVTGDIVTLWSNFPYVLPFTLSYSSQSFREVLLIPESYSLLAIEQIINGADTFVSYFTETGGNPSLTLSAQGLLWKSGDSFIRLGSTASFHGVDLDSGDFKTGVQGWQITKEGNAEFNDGTFRGLLDGADGTFSGDLDIGSDDADRQLSLGSKGLLVKDSLGNIIHDLPNATPTTGGNSLGHLIMFDGTDSSYGIYSADPAPMGAWTSVVCKLFNSTNVKGGLFKIDLLGANYTTPVPSADARVLVRPKGSAWDSFSGLSPELRSKIGLAGGSAFTFIEHSGMLSCPIGTDNSIEFYASLTPIGSTARVKIVQIGVYI